MKATDLGSIVQLGAVGFLGWGFLKMVDYLHIHTEAINGLKIAVEKLITVLDRREDES